MAGISLGSSAESWDFGKQGLWSPSQHSTEVRTCSPGELLRLPSGPSRDCDAGVRGQEAKLPESGWSSRQPCDSGCHVLGCLGAEGPKQHTERHHQGLVASVIPTHGTGPCRVQGILSHRVPAC